MTRYLFIIVCLICNGCTSMITIGRQWEFDELSVKRYQSQVDLSPELIEALKLWLTSKNNDSPLSEAPDFPNFAGASSCITCDVIRVYDGDTFYCNIENWPPIIGKNIGIRINGIDTSELRTSSEKEKRLGYEAKSVAETVLLNAQTVELCELQRGKYFRIVADVYADGDSVADTLIQQGYAVPYFGGTKTKDWSK